MMGADSTTPANRRQPVDRWLVLILLLAALLRIQFVTQPLVDWFSWREASTAMMADNLPKNHWNPLWPQVSWTGDDTGYQGREFQVLTIFAALLDNFFSWRDWHGRLIAALFGLWSVFVLYKVIALLYGLFEARAGSFIFAALGGAIVIDTSYLPDPAMVALSLTACWLILIWLENRKSRYLVFACIAGVFATLAKLPALATLPAALYLALTGRPQSSLWRRVFALTAIVGISAIPVVLYYRWAIYLGRTYPPYHVAGSGWIWDEAVTFVRERFFVRELKQHALGWLWTWPVIVLFVVGALSRPFGETNASRGSAGLRLHAPIFFHVWLAGCVVLYIIAAKELVGNPWNFHIMNPAIAALSGRGFVYAGFLREKAMTLSAYLRFGALGILIAYAGHSAAKQGKVDVFVDDLLLGERLSQLAGPDDLVVVSGGEAGTPLAIYYSRHRGWVFPPPPQQPDYIYYMDDGLPGIQVFEELRQRGARWFGVVKNAHDFSVPPRHFLQHHKLLLDHIAATSELVADTPLYAVYRISPR